MYFFLVSVLLLFFLVLIFSSFHEFLRAALSTLSKIYAHFKDQRGQ